MIAWSKVTSCFAKRIIATMNEALPQPHIFVAATIFVNSFI
jgi:hypothetical protein